MFGRLLEMRSSIVSTIEFSLFVSWLICVPHTYLHSRRHTHTNWNCIEVETITASLMTIKYSDGKNAYRSINELI